MYIASHYNGPKDLSAYPMETQTFYSRLLWRYPLKNMAGGLQGEKMETSSVQLSDFSYSVRLMYKPGEPFPHYADQAADDLHIYIFFNLFLFLDGFSASLSCSSIYFPYILVALTNVVTGSSSLSNYVKHRSTILYQKDSIKLRPDNYNCNYSPKSTNSSILLYKYKYTWTSCFHTHLKHAYYLNCSRVSNSCAEHILKNFKRTIQCIKHSSIITVYT